MKTVITILFLLTSSAFYQVLGQVSAVMVVSVNVISGAGLSAIEEADIDLSTAGFISEDVAAGSFNLESAPGAEVNVRLEKAPVLINNAGESMAFDSLSLVQNTSTTGKHHVKLSGRLKNRQDYNGQYQGAVKVVVEYL